MPHPSILFLKAKVRGDDSPDLFGASPSTAPMPTQVQGHTREGRYIGPYVAIRHHAFDQPPPPAVLAEMDERERDLNADLRAELNERWSAALRARTEARQFLAREHYVRGGGLARPWKGDTWADTPEYQALLRANDTIADLEIAARSIKPSTARSARVLLGIPDSWDVQDTFTAGNARPREARRPKDGEMVRWRYRDGRTIGTHYYFDYGSSQMTQGWRSSRGYENLPLPDLWAKLAARDERHEQRRAEQQRHWEAEQAREKAAAEAAAAELAKPPEMGDGALPPGDYGAINISHARWREPFKQAALDGYVLRFGYDNALVAAVKAIPGRKWDADARAWFVPATSGKELRAALAQIATTTKGGRQRPPLPGRGGPARASPPG